MPAAVRVFWVLGVATFISQTSGIAPAEPIGSGGTRAPLELTTRGMLLQRWDRNRDGKIDIGEAEMARASMRRERMEQAEKSRVDPITGKRNEDLFSAEQGSDDDLFTSPATSLSSGPSAANSGRELSREGASSAGDPAIELPPTMTLLGPPSGLPPTAANRAAADAPRSSASRVFPQSSGQTITPGLDSSAPIGGSRPFERPTSPYGAALTGGIRAGAPAVRPGYGTTGTTTDLNAGRLLGGIPSMTRGTSAQGSSSYQGFLPRSSSGGRPATAPPTSGQYRPPTLPRPGSTPPDFYGP